MSSSCTAPSQEEINKMCGRNNGINLVDLVPMVGPVISQGSKLSKYFQGEQQKYQDELDNAQANYADKEDEWREAITDLTGENTQNIHNLINILFGGDTREPGYLSLLIDLKNWPLYSIIAYFFVFVITALALVVIIFS